MEKLIIQSARPNKDLFDRLTRELQTLIPSSQSKNLEDWAPHFIGNFDDTVLELRRILDLDWNQNINQNLPYNFDYVVMRVNTPADHVQVLTRLFKQGDSQSIFYGRHIARLNEVQFITWISD